MKIVFASHNEKKATEIRSILPEGLSLLTLHDLNYRDEIPEDQPTIEQNSSYKAIWVFRQFGLPCFADDTGLEVTALNGAPGVHTARYAGVSKDDHANMDKLLLELSTKNDRSAQFKTVITYYDGQKEFQFTGIVNGKIAFEKKGLFGFGYDPIFIPEGASNTFSEMTFEQKNKYSHRAKAVAQFLSFLLELD